MKRANGRWLKRTGLVAAVLAALGAASTPFTVPVLAAYACPACYGLERIAPALYVEAAMPDQGRAALKAAIAAGEARVASFYGSYGARPALLACATEACDRKLGGRGARATAYTMPGGTIIRFSPRGLNETIIAHEFSHAELHRRIGIWRLFMGAVPAWFDEGVAVIVSNDDRYLKPGADGPERCTVQPDGPLPASHFEWGAAAGKTPGLYAQAACKTLLWLEANGGWQGVLERNFRGDF